ncbi:hypothetical protein D5S17_19875 [Pseudonocardiaceae bacterium YIM PH 21723]|nr:hypothetical protein D5S17_19875 [Pseudonocardiaceae bacterium YIM PH 21723]
MRERELRRRCRHLLRELDIQPPLDVADLCSRLGTLRGRPIRLVAHPIPVPGPFGVWIASPEVDYILYQAETSRSHQNHIILHELGHMLADHRSDEQDDPLLGELYPDLAPDAVRRALRRTCYDTEQEWEAEIVATIILEWASVADPLAAPVPQDPVARRLSKEFTDRVGWL